MTGNNTLMQKTLSQDAPLLAVEGLCVHFGAEPVIDALDFTVHAGRTLAIVGESGSGKSVSALSILGLTPAAGGTVAQGSIRFTNAAGTHDILTLPPQQLRSIRSPAFQSPR